MRHPKRNHCFIYSHPKSSRVQINSSRILGVGAILCVGLFGFAPMGFTQNTQQPAANPKANPKDQGLAETADKIEIPDLSEADEKTVREEWEKLQNQLEEVEIAYPAKAIELYEQFMNGGATQYGEVAMEVVLRVAGLYNTELQDYEAAVRTYDWGLNAYPKFPAARQVREFRQIAAAKAQGRGGRAPEIPSVGVKAPQANKTQLEPAQVKGMTSQFPLASVKIEPKVVGDTKSVGLVKVPAQPNEAKGVGATKSVGQVKIPVQSNETLIAKVGEVKALNSTVIGNSKTQLPIASVLPKAGAITTDKPTAIQSKIESVDIRQPSQIRMRVNTAPANNLQSLSPVTSVPSSLMPTARPGNYGGWRMGPDRCVTALARQKSGRLWVATEDSGVWYFDEPTSVATSSVSPLTTPRPSRWKQFTAKDGLGDDSAYALAVDRQDRVWVGTLKHGVSVWNGKSWKNYGVLDGPLGERVFDIAVCPTDGDVWIATNAGLTRYSQSEDSWSYITQAEGLPSDQSQALAFDKQGNLIVGTQYDGVALASAAQGYRDWRSVRGPKKMPSTPKGSGLPTDLINDVLVAKNGTIYVATTTGLAWSNDQGVNWFYVRGKDYADKEKGRHEGASAAWREEPGAVLAEDYVTCLAEDEGGLLWIGHWRLGSEVLDMQDGTVDKVNALNLREKDGFVRAILTGENDGPLLARYDEGLTKITGGTKAKQNSGSTVLATGKVGTTITAVPFPSSIKPPTIQQLQSLLKEVETAPQETHQSNLSVIRLTDDWITQGDWLGRYGRYWSCLCAFSSPRNYVWGAGEQPVHYMLGIGPQRQSDSLRYWVHWLSTDNPRVLEMPAIYADSRVKKGLTTAGLLRRQAEVDDHGEAYPLTQEGPDIYVSLSIPPGRYTLSFYNHNKDGESGMNRLRDYEISLRSRPVDASLDSIENFEQWPELARSRQRDFRGGVYQKFLLSGPQELTVKFSRNNSFNTILAGIFLDELNEEPQPYFRKSKIELAATLTKKTLEGEVVTQLWDALEKTKTNKPRWWATSSRRYYAALARCKQLSFPSARGGASNTSEDVLKEMGTGFYNLNMFAAWEETQRQRRLTTARDIEKSLTWDGKLWDERGQGNRLITAFLTAPKTSK